MQDLARRAVSAIEKMVAHDHLKARLTCAALVNTILRPEGLRTLVVGGTAVDTYVGGAFGSSESLPSGWQVSMDIDSIALQGLFGVSSGRAADVLAAQGFVRVGAGSAVRHPDIPFVIDFVGFGFPDDYSTDHAVTLYVEEWEEMHLDHAFLAGPEDILFDYTESGADMRNARDWARAVAIGDAMDGRLDLGYLFTKAEWRLNGEFVPALERVLRGEPLDPSVRR